MTFDKNYGFKKIFKLFLSLFRLACQHQITDLPSQHATINSLYAQKVHVMIDLIK